MSTLGGSVCFESPFSSSRPLGQYEAEAVGRAPDLMDAGLLEQGLGNTARIYDKMRFL